MRSSNKEDLELIQSFATQAAIVMERNVFYTQTEELRKLAITDSLTGLLNRRYLSDRLEEELLRSPETWPAFKSSDGGYRWV